MPEQDKHPTPPAEYLGDGLYAIFDGHGIWLHANDHLNPTDKVYLEPAVLKNFCRFLEKYYNVRLIKTSPKEVAEKKAYDAACDRQDEKGDENEN